MGGRDSGSVVEIDRVSFRYRHGSWVLQAVSARIVRGDVVLLSGRNGAGKSTLMRLLAGAIAPTRGNISRSVAITGLAPERFPSSQAFTVRRYLSGMGRVYGLTTREARAATETWSERLGLRAQLDTPLSHLSKGTAQKVGLAQAMLGSPMLLLLDEPWSGLDADARAEVPRMIEEVRSRSGAVCFTDHTGSTGATSVSRSWTLSAAGELAESPPSLAESAPPSPAEVVTVAIPGAHVVALQRFVADRGGRIINTDRETR